jgi:hypothetical protein
MIGSTLQDALFANPLKPDEFRRALELNRFFGMQTFNPRDFDPSLGQPPTFDEIGHKIADVCRYCGTNPNGTTCKQCGAAQ